MTKSLRQFRIGIDVGGTFTHAVAISSPGLTLVGRVKVPTTHHAANGVGEGVVLALTELLKNSSILASEISVVAHSTTQATNSLLEGDVEKVAIISVGEGIQGRLTHRSASLGNIPLAPGKFLKTRSHYLNRRDKLAEAHLNSFLDDCLAKDFKVAVVVGPFSVDDSLEEKTVAEYVQGRGFAAIPPSEVAQLSGVRTRVRTTAINASILPKMMEVTNHTEREIRKMGITAPLMIMRSDGGVMTVEEMRKKPILTLLSGPAAGIAAALRFLHITDGIFLEVGGTSTDVSVIKNGRAISRSATIGGNKTFLKTLDCRTLGVGGGSLPRVSGAKIVDVGPRSAHIAGVHYAAFDGGKLSAEQIANLKLTLVQPKSDDPSDYQVFESEALKQKFSITPTCAANVLGLVPVQDCAMAAPGFPEAWREMFQARAGVSLEVFSEEILTSTSKKISETVEALLKEYKMKPKWTTLVGGGGGASAIVPHLAKHLGMKHEIAEENDVISAIGVALGLIREVIERSVINATPDDIYELRQEVRKKVLTQGAAPETIEVFIEIDQKKNVIRAEAHGSIEYTQTGPELSKPKLNAMTDLEIATFIQESLTLPRQPENLGRADTHGLSAYSFTIRQDVLRGFLPDKIQKMVVVMDPRWVFRLKLTEADMVISTAGSAVSALIKNLDRFTVYGDGGINYPYIYCLLGDRVIDLSKLNSPEHFTTVLDIEVREAPAQEPVVIIFSHPEVD